MTHEEFMHIYQHSDLEDKIDKLMYQMYCNGYSCKDISIQLLQQYDIFTDFDVDKNDYSNNGKDIYTEIKSIIYSCYRQFCREQNKPTQAEIYTIDNLYSIDDNYYHTTSLKFSIDAPIRDYPFIIYNDKFFSSNKCKTHKEILERLLSVQTISTNVRELDAIIGLPYKPIIFGSIVKDICVVDAYEECSEKYMTGTILKRDFKHNFYFDFIHNRIKKL